MRLRRVRRLLKGDWRLGVMSMSLVVVVGVGIGFVMCDVWFVMAF